jgi:hypothetical protein
MSDRGEAFRKARQFADAAYNDALSKSTKDLQDSLHAQQNQLSARGLVRSGVMLHGTCQLYAKHIDGLVLARLEGILEGHELHKVPIEEQPASSIIDEVMNLKDGLLNHATQTVSDVDRGGAFTPEQFAEHLKGECRVSRTSVTVAVERHRLKPKESSGMNVIYQVSGHGRMNINSTDNSVNIINVSREEIFTKLRQEIATGVPAGEQQGEILTRLSELEAAQNSPSFALRYVDFINTAANHMTLILPFVPALTEMMRNVLGK